MGRWARGQAGRWVDEWGGGWALATLQPLELGSGTAALLAVEVCRRSTCASQAERHCTVAVVKTPGATRSTPADTLLHQGQQTHRSCNLLSGKQKQSALAGSRQHCQLVSSKLPLTRSSTLIAGLQAVWLAGFKCRPVGKYKSVYF